MRLVKCLTSQGDFKFQHPFTMIVSGSTGSGKYPNLLYLQILTQSDFCIKLNNFYVYM